MEIQKGPSTLFLTHQNADPDAVGSIYFLKQRFDGDIGLPNQPGRKGKKLAEYLEMDYILEPDVSEYEQVVVVDTPNPKQLSPIELDGVENFVVIDHHSTQLWEREIIYEDRSSCAEILYEMFEPAELTKKEAVGLSAGIITDTSHFRRAGVKTFRVMSELLEKGGLKVSEVTDILRTERSYSEKICRLKGAKRLHYLRVNGFLIAHTMVATFESSVSSMLLGTGADISFTASQRDDNILLSGRARHGLIEEGLDLGRLMKEISSKKKGLSGGGHEGAAVLKGEGDAKKLLNECVRRAVDEIREKGLSRSKN